MKSRQSGYALAALIFFLTAASIMLAAAVPVYQMQAKRVQEEELIFRGEEYARAIQKFQRRFGVFPPSVDALVETNGLRFLRKPYLDPMTGKEFKLITISPDGTVSGSSLFSQRMNNPTRERNCSKCNNSCNSGVSSKGSRAVRVANKVVANRFKRRDVAASKASKVSRASADCKAYQVSRGSKVRRRRAVPELSAWFRRATRNR